VLDNVLVCVGLYFHHVEVLDHGGIVLVDRDKVTTELHNPLSGLDGEVRLQHDPPF
jgi:uncharacterized membrane protein (Fun14 family)